MKRLHELQRNQHGAVAMLVLVAILICFLLALTVFDATIAARQKIDVQTAADTAAWSQSAVEARAMNMIAFANVGKRIIIGMATYYESIWAAWLEMLGAEIVIEVVLAIVCIVTIKGGCTTKDAMKEVGKVIVETAWVIGQEFMDGWHFFGKDPTGIIPSWVTALIPSKGILDKVKKDVKSFDDYQKYQAELAPWWSWAEGTMRGSRNGASSVGLFPVPERLIPDGPIDVGSELIDKLPVKKASSSHQMCVRSMAPDLPVHMADYVIKSQMCDECVEDKVADDGTRRALHAGAAVLASANYLPLCLATVPLTYGSAATPYEMAAFNSESEWLLASSNLAFSYRAGKDFTQTREKYDYMTRDYALGFDLGGLRKQLYESDGYFGIARSEISYQGGAPDMWHSSWSARMRPVALPGEWDGYPGDTELLTAYNDSVPYLVAGAGVSMATSESGETMSAFDFIRGVMAFEAYTHNNLPGMTR